MIPPVQLWLGSSDTLNEFFLNYACKHFCKQAGCGKCIICTQLKNNEFYAVKRLAPDKSSYTVSYLDDMMTEVAFKRDEDDLFFYVFSQAQLLNVATANRLLKKFEEPTPGYHYILFAESKESILPTIVSRSVIVDHRSAMDSTEHVLVEGLMQKNISLSQLAKIIEKEVPSETQTRILLESIINKLSTVVMQNPMDTHVYQFRLKICIEFLHHLPMPGGSKLFWRSLLLRMFS